MRIAILLGVSQYKHPSACALPAATADVATMKALVEATGEFQEVLIPTATDHLTVKRELAAFVDAQKGQTVEQVLFYFSGHGLLQDGVFHYLLSAYDPDQLKTTSLESPELDGLLRSLRPSVVIKIVDACQSGNMYIKSADDIRKSVELSGAAFKNVYFLFSSLPEQSSYANKYESFFTAAVARAACAFAGGDMRYKDVIDRVADDKDLRAHQTPIFVVQAEFTEKFGRLPPNVAETMTAAAASVRGEASKRRALVDIVREQSATYAEEDAVRKHLEALPDEILALGADGAATELFELTTQLIADFRTSLVPDRSGIAAWLHEHRDEEYFVTIKLEQYRETPGGPLEVAPLGFSSTVELPFKGLLVALEPKFANLRKYYVVVIPVVSPTSIRLFYCLGQFRRVSWTEFRATPAQEWKTHAVVPNDKDATGSMATVVLAELLVAADDDLSKRFGKGMVDDDEDGDGEG